MERELLWTKKARHTYLNILLYLQDRWDEKVLKSFVERVERTLETIRRMPFIYPASQKSQDKKIRKCVIRRQTSLYYHVT
jgi:plasmid stabilization system protein ParE